MPENGNGHNLFEAIAQLFGRGAPADAVKPPKQTPDASLAAMETDFNNALRQLNQKIEELRRQKAQEFGQADASLAAMAADREARLQRIHAQVTEEILAVHLRLKTAIDQAQHESLLVFLQDCARQVLQGQGGLEVIQCCRSSILRRFHREAGPVAWAELEHALAMAGESWPETTRRDPLEDEAAFELRLQHKYREAATAFAGYEVARSAELMQGIERAWQSDYPESGTPLWRELVLEGVATGLRARIFKGYVDQLQQHRGVIVVRAGELVGKELAELHRVLAEKGPGNLEDAHRVAVSSRRVLDEVIPDLAWQVISSNQTG